MSTEEKEHDDDDDEDEVDVNSRYGKKRRVVDAAVERLHEELLGVQKINETAPAYQVKSMSVDEQRRLQRLIAKHGDDVKAMARDIKINIMQQTEAQLTKRISLLRRLQLA